MSSSIHRYFYPTLSNYQYSTTKFFKPQSKQTIRAQIRYREPTSISSISLFQPSPWIQTVLYANYLALQPTTVLDALVCAAIHTILAAYQATTNTIRRASLHYYRRYPTCNGIVTTASLIHSTVHLEASCRSCICALRQ